MAIFFKELKRQILLAYQGAYMCQNHYKHIPGTVLYQNFLNSIHSRRVIQNPQLLTRLEVAGCISAAIIEYPAIKDSSKLAETTNADIDEGELKIVVGSDEAKKNQKFNIYHGLLFTNIICKQKAGVAMCSEHLVKDRASSDMCESINLAVGANTELKMLLGGLTCAAALLATLLAAKEELLKDLYEVVASLIQSKSGLSLLYFRQVPVFFEGKLLFKIKGSKNLISLD